MGWNGIGIGWPNASAQAGPPVVMGYFKIDQACDGTLYDAVTSQLVDTSLYTSGNSIFGTFSGAINYQAVTLGAIVFSPGDAIFEISGPSYTTCPVYYIIEGRCDGEPYEKRTTIAVSNGTYNAGEYLYSTSLNTIVLIGENQNTPGEQQITVTGPNLGGCLVSYDVYDCIQGESYITGYYNAGTFGSGDRVYTQSGNYGYVNNPVEYQEGDTDTEAFPIGFVDYRCNDSNVTFSFEVNSDGSDWYLDLYANVAGDVNFESTTNELTIDVNYEIYLTAEEDPPITMSGTVAFEIASYNVPTGSGPILMHEQYAFSLSEDYNVDSEQYNVTSISVNPIALGPYDLGSGQFRYVTEYGNVWTFNYPT